MGANDLEKRTPQERLIIAKTLLETVLDDIRFAQKVQLSGEDATSDLISRQDAIRLAEQGQIQGFEWQFKKLCTLPPAEPELILCKDCKHWYKDADSGMSCEYTEMSQPEDGFCNWAERKEE